MAFYALRLYLTHVISESFQRERGAGQCCYWQQWAFPLCRRELAGDQQPGESSFNEEMGGEIIDFVHSCSPEPESRSKSRARAGYTGNTCAFQASSSVPSVKQASAHGGSFVTQKHPSQVFKLVISLPGGSRVSCSKGGGGWGGLG